MSQLPRSSDTRRETRSVTVLVFLVLHAWAFVLVYCTAGISLLTALFFLAYTVFSATGDKRSARDSHVPVLAPLPIGFAVFIVHLATMRITGTGINPARSFAAAVIYIDDRV